MKFKDAYPDFAAVEAHIRRARAERSVAVATLICTGITRVVVAIRQYAGKARADRQRMAEALRDSGRRGEATGKFERLGNSHREVLDAIRASTRREILTATGSFISRPDLRR
jgi:hypothetical protein